MSLRIAVVGAGRVGAIHAENVANHPGAELLYVVDPDPERGRLVAQGHHIWRPRLDQVPAEHVDAIIVASPTRYHCEHIAWALERNLGVLCEKPLGGDADQLAQLQERFPRAPVMAGFNRRFDPTFAALHQRLREGDIGPVYQALITSRDPSPPSADYRTTSGGMLRDMTIHDFDMALFLTDDVDSVFAVGHREVDDAILGGEYSYDERLDADFATIVLTRSDGATTTISNARSCASGYDQRIEVHGPYGTLNADNLRPTALKFSGSDGSAVEDPFVEFFTDRYEQAYTRELDAFLAAVRGEGEWSPSLVDAEAALRVADAAERSMLSGERVPVSLPERPHTDSLPMIAPPQRAPRSEPQRSVRTSEKSPGHGPLTASAAVFHDGADFTPVTNERIVAAPISWGVCEAPGWGYQMRRVDVLQDMSDLGFTGIETGPSGWLGDTALDIKERIDGTSITTLVGSFVPLVMHDPGHNPLPEARSAMEELVGANVQKMVLAAVFADGQYTNAYGLTEADELRVAHRCNMIADLGDKMGIDVVMHPHHGTVIHRRRSIDTIVEHSGVNLCLDTGHLLIGDVDPLDLVRDYPDRIGHVHLKDVHPDVLEQLTGGALEYRDAVREGLYVQLGKGAARIAEVIKALQGYEGVFVIEHDRVIDPDKINERMPGLQVDRLRAVIRQEVAGSAAFVHALLE